ncbi:peptide deformylase [Candidatus Carsonella ruddii]|uniref:Peptide deformylase n=1 Tax=Carsonella ruddii TaxID=114186 RepID=A0A1U9RRU3_CARRU|nr:peptide deformylase [Candidatus Carsonella ruddii]AQU89607.1 Peptide deformylase [Candidatus Carsonella ruddii]
MFLKILNIKDKRLRIKSKKMLFYNKIKKLFLIKRMIFTMYEKKGIGIASSQINFKNKIIIIDLNKKNKPSIIINPLVIKNSSLFTLSTEGCLSIKNFFINIPRPEKIFLNFINLYNKNKKKIFNNINSRCLQHEIDHLNSILIIDYMNKIIKNE